MNREQSMSSRTTESSAQAPPLGENAHIAPPQPGQPGPPEHQNSRSRNQVIKSGPLFISSKGIGWTSWKKRWFVLSRTSLVFFRSDPSAASPKGGEMNLTLGGIDLNSSASVEVKADKKLLTVFFPDGRDGRAFTLKAETLDDLYEWKAALETAVAQAPSASAIGLGQNGMFNTEQDEASNDPAEQRYENDRLPGKSMVIGRPVLLALEDIDGSPSFLEKALRFIEQRGVRVEGILRQAADVDHVYRRVHEYQQGKTEFSPGEDAHVIADCIKYILRELPSSPVPATCCTALLEAFRSDRNNRLNNMRTAILETFPEPNRRLLQRILLMMQRVAAHKAVNRMSVSAVAACMSPLLLRPLLAGECELEKTHMDVAGDGSFQLLQAAAAANHAQAIVITLLEEYDNIFGSPLNYSRTQMRVTLGLRRALMMMTYMTTTMMTIMRTHQGQAVIMNIQDQRHVAEVVTMEAAIHMMIRKVKVPAHLPSHRRVHAPSLIKKFTPGEQNRDCHLQHLISMGIWGVSIVPRNRIRLLL